MKVIKIKSCLECPGLEVHNIWITRGINIYKYYCVQGKWIKQEDGSLLINNSIKPMTIRSINKIPKRCPLEDYKEVKTNDISQTI
jgi:hypothetical protein